MLVNADSFCEKSEVYFRRKIMKKGVIAIIVLVVVVAGSIFVIAQKAHRGDHGQFGAMGGHRGMMGMALRGLNLTDDQKAKVKDILSANRGNVEPLMQQARDNRKQLAALGTDGNFDQAKVEALASQQADIMSKMIVNREKVKAQIFAILTDEQKAKAAEMRQKMEQRFKDRQGKNPKGDKEE
jgi:periplasmic protein CpxP/Spy